MAAYRSSISPEIRKSLNLNLRFAIEQAEEMSTGFAVVLSAELDRWVRFHGNRRLVVSKENEWNPIVLETLRELGALDLITSKDVTANLPSASELSLVKLVTGEASDGSLIESLQNALKVAVSNWTYNMELSNALVEAVTNSFEHAYIFEGQLPFKLKGNKWWAACTLDREKQIIRFFIYDQGRGIASTLENYQGFEQVKSFLRNRFGMRNYDDVELIEAALEVGKSRFDSDHRGTGLFQMKNVVDELAEGSEFRILSGRGEIRYSSGKLEKTVHSAHLGGTLIEWKIPCEV